MCGRFKQAKHFDTTNQIMIVNILQNWSHKYSYQYGIIYCIVFEPIHYAVNSYVVYPLWFLTNLIICFYRYIVNLN